MRCGDYPNLLNLLDISTEEVCREMETEHKKASGAYRRRPKNQETRFQPPW